MHVNKVLCIVLVLACLEGCSMLSPAARISEVEHPAPPVQQLAVRVDQAGNRLPIDYSQLQPGSYYKLETIPNEPGSVNESKIANGHSDKPSRTSTRTIAGRIVSVDETCIVLADAISISNTPGKPATVPMTTKVLAYAFYGPLAPRMWKVSGTGRETVVIPGEVTVERSAIRDLQSVDGTNWAYFQNGGQWYERIGIDFDFNIPAGKSSETKYQHSQTNTDLTGLQAGGIDSSKIEHSALADKLNASPKAQPYASVEYLNATTSSAGH